MADGLLDNLKITPLRIANIPPPMSLHEFQLKGNASDVAVNHSSSKIAVLHKNSISLIKYSPKIKEPTKPSIEGTIVIPTSSVLRALQICYLGNEELFVLMSNIQNGTIAVYNVTTSRMYNILTPQSAVVNMFPSQEHDCLCLSNGNEVYKVTFDSPVEAIAERELADLETICAFPNLAPWVEVVRVGEEVCPCFCTCVTH